MKKLKEQKECVTRRDLMLKNYKDCLFNDKIILNSQRRFKSDYHDVYTEQIKVVMMIIRVQTFDKITTYPYGMEQYI